MENQVGAKNAEIEACLQGEEVDYASLRLLIEQRHNLIIDHLASIPADLKREFAEKESDYQQQLDKALGILLDGSREDLAKFLNARKKVAKYK